MAEFLVDKSAFTRRETRAEVQAVVEPLILAGRIATCAIIDLGLLFSARTPSGGWCGGAACLDHQELRAPPLLVRARNACCHSAVAATLLNVNECNPSTPSASA